MSYLC